MKSRFLVTCLLWVWVFAISAPSILYATTKDASFIISLNTNEEEPGEGEKKDSVEETLILTESWYLLPGYTFQDRSLLPAYRPTMQDHIEEIVLPPPQAGTSC